MRSVLIVKRKLTVKVPSPLEKSDKKQGKVSGLDVCFIK